MQLPFGNQKISLLVCTIIYRLQQFVPIASLANFNTAQKPLEQRVKGNQYMYIEAAVRSRDCGVVCHSMALKVPQPNIAKVLFGEAGEFWVQI